MTMKRGAPMAQDHPIISILKEFRAPIEITSTDRVFLEFQSTWNLPIIEKSDFDKAVDYMNKPSQFPNPFEPIAKYFTFVPSQIATLLSFFSNDVSVLNQAYPIVFANVIGYITKNPSMENLLDILKALNVLEKTNIKEKADVLFMNAVLHLIKVCSDPFPPEVIPLLEQKIPCRGYTDHTALLYTAEIMEKLFKDQDKETGYAFLKQINCFVQTFIESAQYFDDTVISRVIQSRIKLFEPEVFTSLSYLSMKPTSEAVKGVFAMISAEFSNVIAKEKCILNFPGATDFPYSSLEENPTFDNLEFNHEINGKSMFEAKVPGTDTVIPLNKLFSPRVMNMLEVCTPVFEQARSIYPELFFTTLTPMILDDQDNIQLYLVFVYLLSRTNSTQSFTMFIFNALFNQKVFEPTLTMFNSPQNFEIMGYVRQVVIETIGTKLPSFLTNVLAKFSSTPYLFAEMCMRIQYVLGAGVVFSEDIFKELISVEHKFRFIYENVSDEYKSTAISARSAIFVFVFSVLKSPTAAISCFSSKIFAKAFLTAFFEPSFSKLVFSKLNQVFQTMDSDEKANPTSEFIASALKILSMSTLNERTTELAFGLISCVTDAIPLNPRVVNSCGHILQTAIELTEIAPSQEFFSQILTLALQMFLHIEDFNLDESAIQKISNIIRTIEGRDLSEATMTKLLCLLATSQSVNSNFLAMIQKPSILPLMISAYTGAKQFENLFQLLSNLCKFSCYNCFKMHEGEVDLCLLDMIANFPNSFTFRGCVIDNFDDADEIIRTIMPVLGQIMSYRSSPLVAERVMKIVCPSDGAFLPLSSSFANSFFMLVKQLQIERPLAVPIALENKIYETENESPSMSEVVGMSSFSFWMKLDTVLAKQMCTKVSIIRGTLNNEIVFNIFMRQLVLFCEIACGDKIASYKFSDDLPGSVWNLVIVNFIKDPKLEILKIQSKINKDNILKNTSKIRLSELPQGKVTWSIGGNPKSDGNIQFNRDMILGVYQVSALTCYSGHISIAIFDNVFFGGAFGQPSSDIPIRFTTHSAVKDQLSPFTEVYPMSKLQSNIVDVFTTKVPPESFIPVFARLKGVTPSYANLLVDFMNTLFGHRIFPYLEMIPYLLSQSPAEILTYQLYQKFFALIEFSRDNNDLKNLLDNILINTDMWGRTPARHLTKIISNWSTALLDPCQSAMTGHAFFKRIFAMLRTNFYYTKVETKVASVEERDDSIDMNMIRFFLDRLIVESARVWFDAKCMKNYLLHCIFCEDKQQIVLLLRLIPVLFQFYKPPLAIANMMHLVNMNSNKEFIFTMLMTIQMYYPDQAYNQCIMLGFHVPAELKYENLDVPDMPELELTLFFPIILMVSLKGNIKVQESVLKKYEDAIEDDRKRNQIIKNSHWYVWFVLFVLQIDPTLHLRGVAMLTKLILQDFDTEVVDAIFGIMDVLRVRTKLPVNKIKALITRDVSNARIDDGESLPHLINFCFCTLFQRFTNSLQNEQLINMAVENDFKDDWSPFKTPIRVNHIYSFNQIKTFMSIPDKMQCQYRLHLADWENMPPSQQIVVSILRDLLGKSPLFTPVLHVIQMISRYPKGNTNKKVLILKIVSDREFMVLQTLLEEKYKKLESITAEIQHFFDQHDSEMIQINSQYQGLSDPVFDVIEKQKKRREIIADQFRVLSQKFMDEDSIWAGQMRFEVRRQFRFLPNFNSSAMKRVVSIPKLVRNTQTIPSDASQIIRASCVTLLVEKPITLSLDKKLLILHFKNKTKTIKPNDVTALFWRSRRQMFTAFEIFLTDGRSYLIDLYPTKITSIIPTLKEVKFPSKSLIQLDPLMQFAKEIDLIGRWNNGELNNFNFLLLLNMVSGRSFHDSSNYPIFPWVTLDHSASPNKMRNFRLPIAAQTTAKIDHFRKQIDSSRVSKDVKFLYGCSISAPIYIASYLVRVEPFTQINKNLHKGVIDKPEGLLMSVSKLFDQIDSTEQCREACPEFFSMPECFVNGAVPDVEPPSWASDPFEWVYLSHKRLNGTDVSKLLGDWVDNYFGVAQRGTEAERRLNTFMPILYPDVWDTAQESPEMIYNVLTNFGSIPQPVFGEPVFFKPRPPQGGYLEMFRFSKLGNTPIVTGDFCRTGGRHTVYMKASDGRVFTSVVNLLMKTNNSTVSQSGSLKAERHRIVSCADTPYAISESGTIKNLAAKSLPDIQAQDGKVNFIESEDGYIMIVDRNGIVRVWESPKFEKPMTVVNTYADAITAATLSPKHDLIVVANASLRLLAYSLRTGRLVHSHALAHIAKAVVVTPDLGLVVAQTPVEIYTLSRNGGALRTCEARRDVELWASWSDRSGTDFIAAADSVGSLLVFEAFYPEKILFSASCGARVVALRYDPVLMGILALTAEPTLKFFPF